MSAFGNWTGTSTFNRALQDPHGEIFFEGFERYSLQSLMTPLFSAGA